MFPDQSYSEQDLIQLITQNDESAFAQLFNCYRNRIYTFALKLTHSTTVAEEIVGDVFLKIWLRRTSLNEIENFKAYINIMARNETYKILKLIAKNYKMISLADNDVSVVSNNPDEYLINKELTSLLHKAIDRLPPNKNKYIS